MSGSDVIRLTRRLFGRVSNLASGTSHSVEVKTKYQGHVLEMEDVNFHTDSAVLLPDYGEQAPQEGTPAQNRITGLAVLVACYGHAKDHPEQNALVVGHTDRSGSESYNQVLSDLRAAGVLYALQGRRADWARVAFYKNRVEDYQQILLWLTHTLGWNCDPGAKDNVNGPKTQQAVTDFKAQYNTRFGGSLPPGSAMTEAAWGAVFDVYMHTLARMMGTDAAGLAEARTSLRPLACGAIGCGEGYPITSDRKENYRSPVDRRVEILFFDPGEEPALDCKAPRGACGELYAKKMYQFIPIPAVPKPVSGKLEIKKLDPHFAPSVEMLDVTYRIKGVAAKAVTLQVVGEGYPVLYERPLTDAEKADGDDKVLQWDGKINKGPQQGRFATPLAGPFKVRLTADGLTEEKPFNILYHSIELHRGVHTPDGALPPTTERIKYAQARLDELGYDAGPVDGAMSDGTRRALRRFQRASYRVGTQTLLALNGALDDDTFQALQSASPRDVWEAGKDPLKDDCRFYVYENYYNDHGVNLVTTTTPEFNSMDRKRYVEDMLDRAFVPLEVEVKILKKDGTGVFAADAVGAVPVAWEVNDGPEDETIVASATNATARTYLGRARQFGTTAGLSGAPRIDQSGDNVPKALHGFREAALAQNVRAWFPDDAGSRLEPYRILRYGKDRRGVTDFHRAIVAAYDHPTDNPARKGRAGIYLRMSTKAGDDAKVRVSITFDGLPTKARLDKVHEGREADLMKETGRWTVWRRMRLSGYCQQRVPTRASGSPSWATVEAWWREAFYEVENGGQPLQVVDYGTVVPEAVYRTAVLGLPATHRPPGLTAANLTYRAGGIYGGPRIQQAPGEAPGDYINRVRNAMIAWCEHPIDAVLQVIHDHVRRTSPEGLIIFDFGVNDQAVTGRVWNAATNTWTPSPNPSHNNRWLSHRGYVRASGAVTMDVDNPFDVSCYVLHECGHARFLYHHHTGGGTVAGGTSDNPNHHDADQQRCAMSYNINPDGPAQWQYPFCGKCLLRLRGWDAVSLPNHYVP